MVHAVYGAFSIEHVERTSERAGSSALRLQCLGPDIRVVGVLPGIGPPSSRQSFKAGLRVALRHLFSCFRCLAPNHSLGIASATRAN